MKHYKDENGNVWAFAADGSQDAAIPDGLLPITSEEAKALLSFPVSREQVWEQIRAERDRRTENGGYECCGNWFHSDLKSRCQQQDNEAAGADLMPVQWRTMDGTMVLMTAELAAQIRVARMASDRAIFVAAEAHRAAMEGSADPAAYDFSKGWPKAFAES